MPVSYGARASQHVVDVPRTGVFPQLPTQSRCPARTKTAVNCGVQCTSTVLHMSSRSPRPGSAVHVDLISSHRKGGHRQQGTVREHRAA